MSSLLAFPHVCTKLLNAHIHTLKKIQKKECKCHVQVAETHWEVQDLLIWRKQEHVCKSLKMFPTCDVCSENEIYSLILQLP